MNKLEQAARALLVHWDTPAWKYLKPTGDLMAALRKALDHSGEADEMVECRHCGFLCKPTPNESKKWYPLEQAEHEPVAWHHPQCDGQCIACLIEKAVQDAYGTQGRDYMLRHINAAAPFNCKGKCCE